MKLAEVFAAWSLRAAQDEKLRALMPGLSVAIKLRVLDDGASADVLVGDPAEDTSSIILKASEATWIKVLSDNPPPGYQAVGALIRSKSGFEVSGPALLVAQSLAGLERLIEVGRKSQHASKAARMPALGDGLRKLRGGYRILPKDPDGNVIYFEEAGKGVPVLFLHTAGADSRQFIFLMSDAELQASYRMFAFDLPFHGRSLPPESWDGYSYSLRQEDYLGYCLDFIRTVIGEPALVVGCSIGAAISVALAASGSDLVRGVVALEAPADTPDRTNPFLADARVDQRLHNPAYIRGLMAPASPQWGRDLACWIYSQGGPHVYLGDVAFYSREYDARKLASRIDTSRCPLTLLTGEYDYSASPESSQRLAAMVPGASITIMKNIGHFPMTENPELLLSYLKPALKEIVDSTD